MSIKISGTTVINDSRNITDVENFGNSDTVYTGSGANLTGIGWVTSLQQVVLFLMVEHTY